MTAIESGASIYQRYFVRKWSGSLRAKQRAWPHLYQFDTMGRLSGLRAMTARSWVARHTDFGSLEEYLDGYSITGERLARPDGSGHHHHCRG